MKEVANSIHVVPLPAQRLCDFCGQATAHATEFPCRDFVLTEYGYESVGAWHACETCSRLITDEEWDKLQARAIELFHAARPDLTDRSKSVAFVSALHRAFRNNKIA
jgi:hypothetical protein